MPSGLSAFGIQQNIENMENVANTTDKSSEVETGYTKTDVNEVTLLLKLMDNCVAKRSVKGNFDIDVILEAENREIVKEKIESETSDKLHASEGTDDRHGLKLLIYKKSLSFIIEGEIVANGSLAQPESNGSKNLPKEAKEQSLSFFVENSIRVNLLTKIQNSEIAGPETEVEPGYIPQNTGNSNSKEKIKPLQRQKAVNLTL